MSEYVGKTVADWYKYFSRVLDLCQNMLRNIYDAEDVVQDVYEKLIIKERRGKDFTEIDSELGYIKRIAYNLCLDRLNERKKNFGNCFPFFEDEIPADNNYKKDLEIKEMIRALMETESEETRLYYYYYYVEEKTLKEIKEKVGKSTSWIQRKLADLRKQARRKLEEDLK